MYVSVYVRSEEEWSEKWCESVKKTNRKLEGSKIVLATYQGNKIP